MADGVIRGACLDHRDLVIPLAISVIHWRHSLYPHYVAAATRVAQPIIQAAIDEAARTGWKADEPTEFATLFSRARVRTKQGILFWRVSSVTIRLTRPSGWVGPVSGPVSEGAEVSISLARTSPRPERRT